MPLDVRGSQDELSDLAIDLREDVGAGEPARDGVQPYLVGQQALWAGMQDLTKEDLESAEKTGFPIVLLILLAVFGSLAAAALPLALGFASVGITGGVIYFLSQATDMSVFTTNVASMIGIGVAVDYSLFVLARYREEIRAGAEPLGGPPDRAAHLRPGRGLLGHHGDDLPRRPVARGLHHRPLDGHGRDRRRGRLHPRRHHAAAGAHAAARQARLRPRAGRDRHRADVAPASHGPAPPRLDPSRGAPRRLLGALDGARHAPPAGLGPRSPRRVLLVLAIPALSLEFGDGALRQFPEGNETRVGAELAAEEEGRGGLRPGGGRGRLRLRRLRQRGQPRARSPTGRPGCATTPRWRRSRRRSRRATATRRC